MRLPVSLFSAIVALSLSVAGSTTTPAQNLLTQRKHSVRLQSKLITVNTQLRYSEVISRLDAEVNKPGSAQFAQQLAAVNSAEQFRELIYSARGPSGFLWYTQHPYTRWLPWVTGKPVPPGITYVIGNPMVEGSFMQFDIRAGLHVPLRIMVVENESGSTSILYFVPSTTVNSKGNEALEDALKPVDALFDAMVARISS